MDPPPVLTVIFDATIYWNPDTSGRDLTYRWRLSDRQVTDPIHLNVRYPNYNMNIPDPGEQRDFVIPPGEADGSRWTAQLEVLSPNHLLSAQIPFYARHCQIEVTKWFSRPVQQI